jgi:GT2 family glycosyltransferase
MTLTIAVCTGGRDSLIHTIRSVSEQRQAADKFLIVDQSGSGKARAMVDEAGAAATVLDQGVKGLSRARNLVLENLDTDWVFFTDDDCVVSLDLVEQFHKVVAHRPKPAFWVGACIWPLEYDPETQEAPGMTVSRERVFDTENTFNNHGFMGACLAFRRDLIQAVGKFDEELGAGAPLFTGEESDYIIRALSGGFTGWATPRLMVYHEFGVRPKPENPLLNGRLGNAALLWKYQKMGDEVGIRLASRIMPFGPRRAALGRLTFGWLFGDDVKMAGLVRDLNERMDREYEVQDGVLRRKA